MERKKYGQEHMMLMRLVESITGVAPKDVIVNSETTVIVPEHTAGRVIGKGGMNLHKVQQATGRKIRIIEYSHDLAQFVKNIIYPVSADAVEIVEGVVKIKGKDFHTRASIIGRDKKNLKFIKEVASRFFEIADVKVESIS